MVIHSLLLIRDERTLTVAGETRVACDTLGVHSDSELVGVVEVLFCEMYDTSYMTIRMVSLKVSSLNVASALTPEIFCGESSSPVSFRTNN